MGIINCPKHGRSSFFEVCVHADELFNSGQYREFRCIINMLWCDECWEKYTLIRFEKMADMFDEGGNEEVVDSLIVEYQVVYDEMRRQLWCEKCIEELKKIAEKDEEAHE